MQLMRNILTEIHTGKMLFQAENDSTDALRDFQAVAKRIEAAKRLGYIKDAKIHVSRARESCNFAKQVMVIGPLTLEGEKFLLGSIEEDLEF